MAVKFNRKAEVIDRAKAQGKLNNINSGEASRVRNAINDHVMETKRDFQHKERMSRITASKLTLTA